VIASQAASLASLPEAQRTQILDSLTDRQLLELEYDWRFWARPNQIAPEGLWGVWLVLAGRGFGKTASGAHWVRDRWKQGAMKIAIVAETQKDLEEVMVPRLLAIHPEHERPKARFRPVRLVWPNGAEALGYNGTEPDQLRGPEFDTAWVDELAKYKRARELWDMLSFTMRSGADPRVCVTTTPRPIPVLRELMRDETTVITKGSTYDNAANLPKQFLDKLTNRYAGTRLGRQELEAEILKDLVGALWNHNELDETRVKQTPDMVRIIVGVDPSGTKGESDDGDSVGIVVGGKGVDGRAYILADGTCKLSPDGWGRRAVNMYHEYQADRIVAETNYGGAMVEHVVKTIDANVSYSEVKASRGKVVRAEPIAALYEQGKVSHVGSFPELEDQMCMMGPNGFAGEGSPDRVDALVWVLTELILGDNFYSLTGAL
jgi:predicted phage terminase large subunit-like protein